MVEEAVKVLFNQSCSSRTEKLMNLTENARRTTLNYF